MDIIEIPINGIRVTIDIIAKAFLLQSCDWSKHVFCHSRDAEMTVLLMCRSVSGHSMSSMHDSGAERSILAAASPPGCTAAPAGRPSVKGLHSVPEESPQLAQVTRQPLRYLPFP